MTMAGAGAGAGAGAEAGVKTPFGETAPGAGTEATRMAEAAAQVAGAGAGYLRAGE